MSSSSSDSFAVPATPNCLCCESLMERVKEKMTHIEQMRKEVLCNEENCQSLLKKCRYLEQERDFLEKDRGFLSRQNQRLRLENEKLAKMLKEKQLECVENERLLDVIHKDRDECINEKMKVSKFYRMEMKKLSDDNCDLRKESNYLKKKFEEELVKGVVEEDTPKNILSKLVDTITEDRIQNVFVHEEFEKSRQQMDSLLENMSRIELAMSRYFPKFGEEEKTPENSEVHVPATYGREEEKELGCSCNEQHRTLEQLLACPDLDLRIREELDQAKECNSVQEEESEESEQDTSFEMVEENKDN
ncbi:hypothetical protein CAEBREN_14309 [Caenorhabditis brenneri]|uniref:Uncharacterized protein n=1 Tax=Caenorhabditis brenneri TaxID=135651 RepID=G0MF03_CAEBE|nr:hypothetical protein CAEBREN_14309 [Caenorhabditis brenneri]